METRRVSAARPLAERDQTTAHPRVRTHWCLRREHDAARCSGPRAFNDASTYFLHLPRRISHTGVRVSFWEGLKISQHAAGPAQCDSVTYHMSVLTTVTVFAMFTQQPDTCTYPETDKCIRRCPIITKINFNIIISSTSKSSKWSHSIWIPDQSFSSLRISHIPNACYMPTYYILSDLILILFREVRKPRL